MLGQLGKTLAEGVAVGGVRLRCAVAHADQRRRAIRSGQVSRQIETGADAVEIGLAFAGVRLERVGVAGDGGQRQVVGIEQRPYAAAFRGVGCGRVERAEGRIRDETDADVAGAPNDVDLLLEGQVAHGPGAEGEV